MRALSPQRRKVVVLSGTIPHPAAQKNARRGWGIGLEIHRMGAWEWRDAIFW
jgi:hypothetical protein